MSSKPSFHGKMECDGMTHAGTVRTINADQFLIGDLKRSIFIHRTSLASENESRLDGAIQGQLLLVADGIGQDELAAKTSTTVVDTVANYLLTDLQLPNGSLESIEDRVREQLSSAIDASHASLQREVEANPQHREMVATLTLGLVAWPKVYLAHVGNSRCYLYSQRKLKQLTTDHTLAQRSVQQNLIDVDQVRDSKWNNVLWNAIGPGFTAMRPETSSATLSMGDALLFCTDGVTRYVSDRRLTEILRLDRPARETCQLIIDVAREAGGRDNATALVARFRSNERIMQLMDEQIATDELEEPQADIPTKAPSLSQAQTPAENTGE